MTEETFRGSAPHLIYWPPLAYSRGRVSHLSLLFLEMTRTYLGERRGKGVTFLITVLAWQKMGSAGMRASGELWLFADQQHDPAVQTVSQTYTCTQTVAVEWSSILIRQASSLLCHSDFNKFSLCALLTANSLEGLLMKHSVAILYGRADSTIHHYSSLHFCFVNLLGLLVQ